VCVGELGSLKASPLLKSDSMAVYASGYLLYVSDRTLMAQVFDPGRLRLSGEPTPLAKDVGFNATVALPLFSASQTGILVYQSGEAQDGWNLIWVDREGKELGTLGQVDRYMDPMLSPDGTRLAVSSFAGSQGIADLWVYDLVKGTSTRLTFGNGRMNVLPVWAPDGKTLFYAGQGQGSSHIYAKAADGSGSEQVILATANTMELPFSISPDGHLLVYTKRDVARNTEREIWAVPLQGERKPFPIVQNVPRASYASVSLNGKWLAYASDESGRNEIYITPFPSGTAKWQVSNDGGTTPVWRKDSKEMFYLNSTNKIVAVDVDSAGNAVRLTRPHALFQAVVVGPQLGSFTVAPDGKKFLLNSSKSAEANTPFTLVQNWPTRLPR
jgi:eukaryotic-like serine/threonine-protein kinase